MNRTSVGVVVMASACLACGPERGPASLGNAKLSRGAFRLQEYLIPESGPHDVAPAPNGTVWYTAQPGGALGNLNPETGATFQVALGPGSRPHGVIVGPDGAPWVTD